MTLRAFAALFAKDLKVHTGNTVLIVPLVFTAQAVVLAVCERYGVPSLFSWQVGLCALTLPLVALAAAHLLIVRELEGRTRELLDALPLPPAALWGQKFALGLAAVWGILALQLGVAILVTGRVEILPMAWCLRVFARLLAYGACWWVTAALLGLFGRLRMVAWCLLALVATTVGERLAPWGWFALVYDPVSDARWTLAYQPFVGAAVWVVGGVCIAGLLLLRGVHLLAALRLPGSGARGYVALPAALLLLGLVAAEAPRRRWVELPGGRVRAASTRLVPLAEAVAAAVTRVEARGVPLPELVLVEAALLGKPDEWQAFGSEPEQVVGVPSGAEAPVSTVLRRVLLDAWPAEAWRPDGWRVIGLSAALAPPEERPLLAACACLVVEDAPLGWHELVARWGVDVAAALAGERLLATAEQGHAPGTWTWGTLLRALPVAPEGWSAWRPVAEPPARLPPLEWTRRGAAFEVGAPEGELPEGLLVEWSELPLRARWPETYEERPLPADAPVVLPVSPTATVAVRVSLPLAGLGCALRSPWAVRTP